MEKPLLPLLPGAGHLLDDSFHVYRNMLIQVLILAGIGTFTWVTLWVVTGFFPINARDLPTIWIYNIAATSFTVVFSLLSSGAIYYLLDERTGQPSAVKALKLSVAKFLPLVLTTLLGFLAVMLGLILLIIPGLIVAVWLIFTFPVVLFESKSGLAALKRSRELVRGRWWGIFGRLVWMVVALVFMGLVFSFFVSLPLAMFLGFNPKETNQLFSSLVSAPIVTIFTYLLYTHARQTWEAGQRSLAETRQ